MTLELEPVTAPVNRIAGIVPDEPDRAALPPELRRPRTPAEAAALTAPRLSAAESSALWSERNHAAKLQDAALTGYQAAAAIAAEAKRHPAVQAIRDRLEKIEAATRQTNEEIETARQRAETAARDVATAMTAGDDYRPAEDRRDAASADIARLTTRAADLATAHKRVTPEIAKAEDAAVKTAALAKWPAAAEAEAKAERDHAALVERHRAELWASEARVTEAKAFAKEIRWKASTLGVPDDQYADARFAPVA